MRKAWCPNCKETAELKQAEKLTTDGADGVFVVGIDEEGEPEEQEAERPEQAGEDWFCSTCGRKIEDLDALTQAAYEDRAKGRHAAKRIVIPIAICWLVASFAIFKWLWLQLGVAVVIAIGAHFLLRWLLPAHPKLIPAAFVVGCLLPIVAGVALARDPEGDIPEYAEGDTDQHEYNKAGLRQRSAFDRLCGEKKLSLTQKLPVRWPGYLCMDQEEAGELWSECLPHHVYTDDPEHGCQDGTMCCPPEKGEKF